MGNGRGTYDLCGQHSYSSRFFRFSSLLKNESNVLRELHFGLGCKVRERTN